MTRFEYFDLGYARIGMQLGLISVDDITKFIRYKVYLDYRSKGLPRMDAMELACEELKCEKDSIYRAIKFFDNSPNVI